MSEKVIDWALTEKLCNNNTDTAKELMTMLAKELPDYCNQFERLASAKKFNELQSAAHRLHGACCYLGVPKLKTAVKALEDALIAGQHQQLSKHVQAATHAINQVIHEFKA